MHTNYNKQYYYILLLVLFSACNNKLEDTHLTSSTKDISMIGIIDSAEFRKKSIEGKVINLDTMPVAKLVLAGKPRIVPLKNNIHKAGIPMVIDIPKNLKIIVPAVDSVPAPEILKVKTIPYYFNNQEPIKTLPPGFKDEANCNIKFYDEDQGFNGNEIWDIIQDKNHNIWFANEMLIKFDGNFYTQFENIYSPDSGSYHLIVTSLLEDSKGNIWFNMWGSEKGSNIFKFDGKKVISYFAYNDKGRIHINNPNSIIEDREGNLWFGTDIAGVYKYEPESQGYPDGRFIHYTHNEGLISNNIECITEDNDGNIWFGTTDSGICKYELSSNIYPTGRFIHYSTKEGLSTNHVSSLLFDSDGKLWIGTFGGGINIFDGNSFTHLTESEGLSSNLINDMLKDKNGDIWFATHGGGVCKLEIENYDEFKGRFQYFTASDNLNGNYILSIMEDHNGCLWFGSYQNGIMLYDPLSFKHLTRKMGMEFDFLMSPVEDNEGNLWFGEERGGGLCKFDGKNFYYYTRNEGLICDSVISVLHDKNRNIWIGTFGGGLCKFDGKYFHHYNITNGLNDNFINYLHEDKNGNIWIGTENNGVCKFDGKSFTYFTEKEGISDNKIVFIFEDSKSDLWFSTHSKGVDRYDGKHITNFNEEHGLTSNTISSILKDKNEYIWLGTTRFNQNSPEPSESFIQFLCLGRIPKKEGTIYFDILSHDNIKFVVEDKLGSIWIGTENGINHLIIPEDDSLNNIQAKVFYKQDGLKGNNPIINTAFIDSKNRLLFGYHKAITILDLNNYEPPENPPLVNLNNIELEQSFVDYRKLLENTERGIKTLIGANNDISLNNINFTDVTPFYNYPENLELPHYINHITFNYSATDWRAPHKLRYQYKLEGSDNDWRPITNEASAIYTNLPHGYYTFKVKAIGVAEKWSDTFEYSLVIHPPWWYSWWAYTLYGLAILSLIFAWRRYDLKRLRLKQELELEHVQTEKLEELDKMKSRFFSNISHEFRTPLTLILGPLQNLISETTNEGSRQKLNIMHRNARRLQRLINQLLNLSKLEAGKMKLRARKENIVTLSRLFVQSFESYAVQRNIKLLFTSNTDEIPVYVDREKIEKILNNLLSNAFKFTPDGGRIEVVVKSGKSDDGSQKLLIGSQQSTIESLQSAVGSQHYVEIIVSDTGTGISPKLLPHIFDRFYQVDDSYTKDQDGSGIGLALTKELVELHQGEIKVESNPYKLPEGKSTIFTVYLPKGKSHLKPDEILETIETLEEAIAPDIPDLVEPDIVRKQRETLQNGELDTTAPIILVVEDNADLRMYIRGFLDQKYHVIEGEDGKKGLKKAIKEVPDLIISDVMMPKMDGYQLCEKLKTDERTSHIPVILLTARATMESKIEGLETGADDFITKPFEPIELQVRVKNLIEQRNKLKELFKKGVETKEDIIAIGLPALDCQFLEKAKKIVHENMIEPDFSVEDLARELAMSRSQFHRKLRALIDQSATEFIRIIRLTKAAEFILQKKGNISEIAYDVGFNNPSYFTSSFTKHYGMSPKEYFRKYSTQ